LVAWPEPRGTGIAALADVIDTHRVTFMSSVPALWQAALRLTPPPHSTTLRRVHVGSAPLSAALWGKTIRWCGTRRVVNMYGMTECANWIGGESAENASSDDDLVDGLVGRPWGGKFGVVPVGGSMAGTDQGEVVVCSPSLMTGYYRMSEDTNQALAGGWLRTGDIGQLLPDGRLRLLGRTKHEINRGGIKVPAEEIDLLLERHPDVAEACAFALDDPLEGEIVAVALVERPGAKIRDRELTAWCAHMIRREAVPQRLFVLDSLPRNERGKLNRDEVRAVCTRRSSGDGEARNGPFGRQD
jgi:acyl-CoA synthetase (AMP-forming)/AMP-acid ligase II